MDDKKTEYVEHLSVVLQGSEERIARIGPRNYSSVAIVDNDCEHLSHLFCCLAYV